MEITRLPEIRNLDGNEDIEEIKSYLIRLSRGLGSALENISEENISKSLRERGFSSTEREISELKNEIITARLAVRNGNLTPDRAKYFEPAIKAVLLDVEEVITPAGLYDTDKLVIVYIDGITDAKVQTFALCFPYNNYRFEDGTDYTPRYTRDVADEIGRAWRAVLENKKTPETKKYFKKDIKAVLQGVTGFAHSANSFDFTAPITVEMLELTDEKIEIFKKYFPYDYYIFKKGGYAVF